MMKTMENQKKKRRYNQRILDGEKGTFTPLVFTTNGGMRTETKQFYRRFSQQLCENQMLATVILVGGLNDKKALVSFEHASFAL